MSYIAEFFKLRKCGKAKGKYIFYRRMSVDNISDLVIGSFLNIMSKKGNTHKYYVDRKEHVYYDNEGEYYVQYFIREIKQ